MEVNSYGRTKTVNFFEKSSMPKVACKLEIEISSSV